MKIVNQTQKPETSTTKNLGMAAQRAGLGMAAQRLVGAVYRSHRDEEAAAGIPVSATIQGDNAAQVRCHRSQRL